MFLSIYLALISIHKLFITVYLLYAHFSSSSYKEMTHLGNTVMSVGVETCVIEKVCYR